jgi:hypothetical protein
MFSIEANTKNVLNISANNHKKLLHITKNIIAKMNLNNELNNIDYFKLKNITSIYVNEEIKLMNNSDMNSIISEYGFDNSISNYKKHYKILDNINLIMLTYNIINNNYIIIVNVDKKEAISLLQNYIIMKKKRNKYIKKLNVKRESEYLIDKINKEIKCDDAKIILKTIIDKFINRTMKTIDKT